ncbi:MAG: hypothetical protein NTV87_17345 [Ignavibacteriae bacterium]|nr:hypothetical protein [Ignavibacteriota bacterium]
MDVPHQPAATTAAWVDGSLLQITKDSDVHLNQYYSYSQDKNGNLLDDPGKI